MHSVCCRTDRVSRTPLYGRTARSRLPLLSSRPSPACSTATSSQTHASGWPVRGKLHYLTFPTPIFYLYSTTTINHNHSIIYPLLLFSSSTRAEEREELSRAHVVNWSFALVFSVFSEANSRSAFARYTLASPARPATRSSLVGRVWHDLTHSPTHTPNPSSRQHTTASSESQGLTRPSFWSCQRLL